MSSRLQSSTARAYTSLRTSLFFQTFLLLTIAIVASTTTAFILSWHELRSRSEVELGTLAEAKAGIFETTLSAEREALSLLGRSFESLPITTISSTDGFMGLAFFPLEGEETVLAGAINTQQIQESLPINFRSVQHSRFIPQFHDDGWSSYLLSAPLTREGKREGVLIAVFDTEPLASRLTDVAAFGKTAEVLFAINQEGVPLVLRGANSTNGTHFVTASADAGKDSFVRRALAGQNEVSEEKDYAGISVVVASRSLPSVGWSILVKIDRFEFARPFFRLALNITGIGFILVALLSLSTFVMSKRIVRPLEDLSHKLIGLETKKWNYERSIYTGNELEQVDVSAFDLTQRLRGVYEHLEELVAERTKALSKELAEKAAILASMSDGLVVTDTNGKVTYMNHAAETMTRLTRLDTQTLEAHEAVTLFDIAGTRIGERDHPLDIVLREKKPYSPFKDPQFYIRRDLSSHVAVAVLAAPILDGEQCLGAVLSMRDVSDARRIDILKSEFISLVSHQLRTPLSTMRWYLELFGDEPPALSAEQKEYIEQVALANTRMNHLVNALLNASRMELGKFQVSPEGVRFTNIFHRIQRALSIPLQQKNIEIVTNNLESIPLLHTDKNLIEVIIDNLLSNAVKYSSDESKVTVSAKMDATKRIMHIAFTDTGIGIPEEQQRQIGQKLFRGTNARMSDTDGNGLGIYISKLAAEAIGARLTFESAEGKGTTFTLHLPVIELK